PAGEVGPQDRAILLRNRRERRTPVEVLDRVAVLDQREILPLLPRHFVVHEGEVSLAGPPTPGAGVLQAAELLVTPGERLEDPDSIERGTGLREPSVVPEGLREVRAGLRLDRLDEVGPTPHKSLGGYEPALISQPTYLILRTRAPRPGT